MDFLVECAIKPVFYFPQSLVEYCGAKYQRGKVSFELFDEIFAKDFDIIEGIVFGIK